MILCRSVFPCGDAMVAIIDDREDVWGRCPNLIHVKPYLFFAGTSDINAPPPRPSSSQSAQESSSSPPKQDTPFKTHRQSSKRNHSVARTSTTNTTLHPGNEETETCQGKETPLAPFATSVEENSREKSNEVVSKTDAKLVPPPVQGTIVTEKTEDKETVIPDGEKDEGQGDQVKPTDVNGSSSSSSDSDNSSSSSSGIDDTLFEEFGEEEKTNTAQDETVNNGQAEVTSSSVSSDTPLKKDVPTDERDTSGAEAAQEEVKMEVEEIQECVKEKEENSKQPTGKSEYIHNIIMCFNASVVTVQMKMPKLEKLAWMWFHPRQITPILTTLSWKSCSSNHQLIH